MSTNILSIGQSALAAAQVGISVTGNNIANASTDGYSREVVIQAPAKAQNFGYGYLGQGVQISTVSRVYNQFLAQQANSAQSASTATNTYASQISQIDNMLSDTNAGLSPAMQSFFNNLNNLSASPGDSATRQAVLSSGQSLVDRFQSIGSNINQLREGVNTQLSNNAALATSYASQIAKLNDSISKAVATDNTSPPNDLLDQRDLLVSKLNSVIQANVIKQSDGSYNVFVGNGLPLVVGNKSFGLTTQSSPTDPNRLEIAYVQGSNVSNVGDNSLPGGAIGGLLQFRNNSLDSIQNQLGQIAIGLTQTFNQQQQQGTDINGNPGTNFFNVPNPEVNASSNNTGNAVITASITDVSKLTSSDYQVKYDGTNYNITKVSDGTTQSFSSLPQTVDGVSISLQSGSMATNDQFLVRPTYDAATSISMAITDISKIAAGSSSVATAAGTTNTGSGSISSTTLSSGYASSPITSATTLTYNSAGSTLSGFPAAAPVTVTNGSTVTNYAAGSTIPYIAGASYSFSGISFTMSGTPGNGDTFSIAPNSAAAPGDNTNALMLAALQSKNTMNGNSMNYDSVFNQLVSDVANKTNELQVTGTAETTMLNQANAAQQSESGVNLDEEASNLLKYQQAYQAAGKMMQIASQLFSTLLSIGQ